MKDGLCIVRKNGQYTQALHVDQETLDLEHLNRKVDENLGYRAQAAAKQVEAQEKKAHDQEKAKRVWEKFQREKRKAMWSVARPALPMAVASGLASFRAIDWQVGLLIVLLCTMVTFFRLGKYYERYRNE